MSSKKDYSNKILRILGEKTAISLPELTKQIKEGECSEKPEYAITRSLKGLKKAGLIEKVQSPQNEYARLTKEGRKKMHFAAYCMLRTAYCSFAATSSI